MTVIFCQGRVKYFGEVKRNDVLLIATHTRLYGEIQRGHLESLLKVTQGHRNHIFKPYLIDN